MVGYGKPTQAPRSFSQAAISIFRIELKTQEIQAAHRVEPTAANKEVRVKSRQHRVLCIDNHASSNLAVYLLERVGYEVKTASSIADGIKAAQSEHFDLQLINHSLVDESEIDSCDKLHKFAIRTPILFYSIVSYPYEQIQPIHCREHRHSMEPVYVYDVAGHASRLIKK